MTPSPADHYYNQGQVEDDELTVKNDKSSESPLYLNFSPTKTKERCKKTQKSFRKFSNVHQSITDLNVRGFPIIIQDAEERNLSTPIQKEGVIQDTIDFHDINRNILKLETEIPRSEHLPRHKTASPCVDRSAISSEKKRCKPYQQRRKYVLLIYLFQSAPKEGCIKFQLTKAYQMKQQSQPSQGLRAVTQIK